MPDPKRAVRRNPADRNRPDRRVPPQGPFAIPRELAGLLGVDEQVARSLLDDIEAGADTAIVSEKLVRVTGPAAAFDKSQFKERFDAFLRTLDPFLKVSLRPAVPEDEDLWSTYVPNAMLITVTGRGLDHAKEFKLGYTAFGPNYQGVEEWSNHSFTYPDIRPQPIRPNGTLSFRFMGPECHNLRGVEAFATTLRGAPITSGPPQDPTCA